MNSFFIAEAHAQNSQATPQGQFSPASLIPLVLIFVIFYFLIIRPQTKKIKEHESLVKNLKNGNKVITSSGIVGIIRKIHEKENQVEVEVAENVVLTILKNHISDVEKQSQEDKKTIKKSDKKR
ncbi:MAG: preprotein translocase subunit YajC [Proteobacteria bacterium]|nr:preprotein translocase subunit YajC [Pseudomonadota bacterium]NCA28105.1 preprotein translocase subunit YajC [Pseudomonadota bacterium]